MKVKGSIAIFAVAAAFAGQVAAYDQTCRDLIGAQGFAATPSAPTGAWQLADAQTGWKSGKKIDCVVPKNRKTFFLFTEQLDPNLCSTYNSLWSADQKYIGKTPSDASAILETYRTTKLAVWYTDGKIDEATYTAMNTAAVRARNCVDGIK